MKTYTLETMYAPCGCYHECRYGKFGHGKSALEVARLYAAEIKAKETKNDR